MKPVRIFFDIFEKMINFCAWIAGVLIFLMMIFGIYGVLSRFLFGKSVAWTIEFTNYILLISTFMGTAWLLETDQHTSVDVLTNSMSSKVRRILNIWTSILGLFVCLILLFFSLQVTFDNFQRGIKVINIIPIPKYLLLIVIPIGFFLLCGTYVKKIYKACYKL